MNDGLPLSAACVFTIGHSRRSIEAFLVMLHGHGITRVVDGRAVPHLQAAPQFDGEPLAQALRGAGIAYNHLPGLGGQRRPRHNSTNSGMQDASCRGFADYMQTQDFEDSLEILIKLAARGGGLALMGAEMLPWRCHRCLIADALTVRGVPVQHILGVNRCIRHLLTPWAVVDGTTLTYPPAPSAAATGAMPAVPQFPPARTPAGPLSSVMASTRSSAKEGRR